MKKFSPDTPANSCACPPARRATSTPRLATTALAGLLALGWQGALFAGTTEVASKDKTVVEKKAESRIKFSAFLQTGITFNPHDPDDHQNYGREFDDRANEPMLNQVTLTLERALAPEPGKFDYGFKLQAGYGSDGRFLNTLGTLENVQNEIVQPYVVEAYGNVHIPLGQVMSLDVKFGQFGTIVGVETLDPRTNYFYSHNYIFNFGVPFQHLGALGTFHVNPTIDLYAGVTRGVNTSIYDNNGKAAFIGGVGINGLLDGKLTIFGATHIGPENPRESLGAVKVGGGGTVERGDLRYYTDVAVTYKPTDKLTSILEGIYTYDAGFDTDFYGFSETIAYAVNDKLTVSARFEVLRDSDGFFVAQFAANDDFTNIQRGGIPLDARTVGGGPNTYLEATLGAQIKPTKFLTVRPEVRFDHSTKGGPYDDSSRPYSITIGADAIIAF